MHVHVAIIGLDRLGASLGLALKRYQSQAKAEHSFTIIGSDPAGHAMKTAQKMGAVDDFHRALLKATANADLIFVNAPFGSIKDLYAQLGPELKPGAVLLDLSPVKQPVIEWAAQALPRNAKGDPLAYMIGIAPVISAKALYEGEMAVEGARADLFDEAEFLLAPDPKSPAEAIALAEDIIRLMGGRPRFIDPVEHDGLVAATEGLPALVGAALFSNLVNADGWLELRRMVNPTMALAMQSLRYHKAADMGAVLAANRQNVARHLGALIGLLEQVREALLDDADDEAIAGFLQNVHKAWEQWDVKRYSGKWEDAPDIELLPGPFGSVGGFLTGRRKKKDQNGEDDD